MFAERNDLHGRVTDFLEKPIQRRSLEQNFPSRACGLTEHDMRNAFAFRKRDEAIAGPVCRHPHHRGAELLSEREIPLQRVEVGWVDSARRLTWRFH